MWARLVSYALLAGLVFGSGWKLRDYQAAEDEARALAAQQEAILKAQEEFDKRLAERDTKVKELSGRLATLRREQSKRQLEKVKEYAKPIYATCVLPADGLRLLNEDIAAANRAGATP